MTPLNSGAADGPTRAEVEETAKWFTGLQWPDVRGKDYVEVTFGKTFTATETKDGPKVRGVLQHEDEKGFTVIADCTLSHRSFYGGGGWPMIAEFYEKWHDARFGIVIHHISLDDAVKEVLADIEAGKQPDAERRWSFGQKVSERTAVFLLARICAWQDRRDLADQLDAILPEVPSTLATRRGNGGEGTSFRRCVELELAHSLMWKAVEDFGDLKVSRSELLSRFERIIRDFPNSEHLVRAQGVVDILKQMIAEDREHAEKAVLLDAMTPEERVRELIFRLRDQNGRQWSQPGSCDIFYDGRSGGEKGSSPAHQLVDLGHAAVPALIEALSDRRPSRSVGYHRDFYFSHFVLTVGDCAEAILEKIAGRNFWTPQSTSAAMQKDGQTNETRAAVEEWWRSVQSKGEKLILEEGVRAGGQDSIEQARRFTKIDSEAAVVAVPVGIRASDSKWVHEGLVDALADIASDSATQALRVLLKECGSLDGRVAAARALLQRGEISAVLAMIEEMKNWKAPERDNSSLDPGSADALIEFLASSNDPTAMRVLNDQSERLPIRTKIKVIEAAADFDREFRYYRTPKGPRSMEVEEVAEALLVRALDDRTVQTGAMGNRGIIVYRDPRVCDMALLGLVTHWPDRYPFKWERTRLDRDHQIASARNVWRKLKALPETPLPDRPTHPSASQDPNVLVSLEWSGEPLDLPVSIGQPLTAKALIETLAKLHSEMPNDCTGFRFSLERPTDGLGGVMQVEWVKGIRKSRSGWSYSVNIALDDDSLYNSSGSGNYEHRAAPSSYKDEEHAIKRALETDSWKAVTIYFTGRVSDRRTTRSCWRNGSNGGRSSAAGGERVRRSHPLSKGPFASLSGKCSELWLREEFAVREMAERTAHQWISLVCTLAFPHNALGV